MRIAIVGASETEVRFLEFLRSFKNAESLDAELRQLLSVPTGLEEFVVNALDGRRVALITGSAGSGKTHLLHGIRKQLEGRARVVEELRTTRDPHYLLIPDATVLTPEDRLAAVTRRPANRLGTLIAINEGPLRDSASLEGGELYSQAVDRLHQSKRGLKGPFNADTPTIVDMAAFDPLEAKVVESILALPILTSAVKHVSPGTHSLRRRAWGLLASPEARRRVAQIIQLARLAQPEWLFRDVWDFVADLALGGGDRSDDASSAWFWRLFYGDSAMSAAIRSVADPIKFALPIVESRIFHREWDSEFLQLVDGLRPLPFFAADTSSGLDWETWSKTQYLVLGKNFDLSANVYRSGQGRLLEAIWSDRVSEVLGCINEYMTFGLRDGSTSRLDLWVDHRIERRTRHHEGLVRLGEAAASEFSITASQVVANHPSGEVPFLGKERFLVHGATKAVFALERARLRTMETARSIRIADRSHADLDWDLHAFFARILSKQGFESQVDIYSLDVESGRAKQSRYNVSELPPIVEEAG